MKRTPPRKSYKHYLRIIGQHRDLLAQKYGVKEIGIFGSTVRGEHNNRSDLDILVDFDRVPDLLKFIELERHLKSLLRKKVDLIDKQGIRPELRSQILNEVVYL